MLTARGDLRTHSIGIRRGPRRILKILSNPARHDSDGCCANCCGGFAARVNSHAERKRAAAELKKQTKKYEEKPKYNHEDLKHLRKPEGLSTNCCMDMLYKPVGSGDPPEMRLRWRFLRTVWTIFRYVMYMGSTVLFLIRATGRLDQSSRNKCGRSVPLD